jgi:hypothetical protein
MVQINFMAHSSDVSRSLDLCAFDLVQLIYDCETKGKAVTEEGESPMMQFRSFKRARLY